MRVQAALVVEVRVPMATEAVEAVATAREEQGKETAAVGVEEAQAGSVVVVVSAVVVVMAAVKEEERAGKVATVEVGNSHPTRAAASRSRSRDRTHRTQTSVRQRAP